MPTYEISAPNGKTYQINGPAGASQEQVQAEVLRQFPEAAGPTASAPAETRSTVTRAYESVASPITRGLGRSMATVMDTGLAPDSLRPVLDDAGQIIARAAVPQTPIEALSLVGTGGAGYLARGAGRGMQALSRILGGLVGGEAGGQLSGEPTGKGAAVGGGGALVGEGAGAIGSKIAQSRSGARAVINAADTARIGAAGHTIAPSLGPLGTVQKIRQAAVEAPQRLGAAKEQAVQSIEGRLPGGVPSKFKDIGTPPPGVVDPGEWGAAAQAAAETSKFSSALPATYIDIPTLGKSLPLREANDELSRVGEMLRGIRPLDPRYRDVNLKDAYGALARDIRKGILEHGGDEAAAMWDAAQAAYKAGRAFIKPFQTGQAYRPGSGTEDLQLNVPALQRILLDPKNEAAFRAKLGDAGFMAFVNALTRGGGVGGVDVMAPGAGKTLDALKQVFGRGQGGAPQLIGSMLRTAAPNIGSDYAGRALYVLPPALQTILDAALQRAGGAATQR